jgi:hypothetical protein
VDNSPAYQNRGYDSIWFYQIKDSCGVPMDGADMHEAFPNGFTFDYPGEVGWGTPTANSWITGNTGLWDDGIAEYYLAGANINPLPLPPQNPLQNVLIYHGHQNIYVGNHPGTLVYSVKQAHYQDHGGYCTTCN